MKPYHNGFVIITIPLWYLGCFNHHKDTFTMKQQQHELTPDRIRMIRERLGLTQKEAGKLLGGGPHAFTKYEAGILKPNAAMTNLLRMLDEYPQALGVLGRGETPPRSSWGPSPFEVKPGNFALLSPLAFTELLDRLLIAEAVRNNLPMDGIHVASNIYARDGGEDGRISWPNDPDRTLFLPSKLCQFQLKAGKISPKSAGREVLTSEGTVKPIVRSVLEQGGHYIMLCAHPYNKRSTDARQVSIRNALKNAGLPVSSDRVIFRGGDQVAIWVNAYSPVALWVREKVGLVSLGGFVTWEHWRNRSDHSVPWVEDSRLTKLSERLQSTVTKPRAVLRVAGLPGVGKSRLCLEALKRLGEDKVFGRTLRDLVVYTVQSEVGATAICQTVEGLAASGNRAILVVDDCDAQTNQTLVEKVLRDGSRLSLITIDSEIPEWINADTIIINKAPATVTESIVDSISVKLRNMDRGRLARLSRGFPEVAARIAKESDKEQYLIDPVDGYFIDKFICGRTSTEKELLLKSAQILAVFGPIRIAPVNEWCGDTGMELAAEKHLAIIAGLCNQLTQDGLYKGAQRLIQRGVVRQRGRLVTLEPLPIAVRLAKRQWEEWDSTKWDRVLSGNIGSDLSVSAARRLAELNATEIAKRVIDHVCRKNGPFDAINGIEAPGRAEILSALAEINPEAVADYIDRCLHHLDALPKIGDYVHFYLAQALKTIAFRSPTFKIGARLLLRLEVAKPPSLLPDVSHPFAKLFPPILGATEADGNARLKFIDEVINEAGRMSGQAQLKYVIDALIEGCSTGGYSHTVGPEIQGSRKALYPWHPNLKERSEYIEGCVDRLGILAVRNDDVGEKARSSFGGSILPLICRGYLEVVEKVIHTVIDAGHSWGTMALRQLKDSLANYSEHISEDSHGRVRSLIEKLEATNLRERIRINVAEPPMPEIREGDSPMEAQYKRCRNTVQELANELIQDSSTLIEILPEISRGQQFMADELGASLAKHAQSPRMLLDPIVKAIEDIPASDRNYDLLVGFIAGLPAEFRDEVEEFKTKAIASPKLAPAFPMICGRVELTSVDIKRAIVALNKDILSPWDLYHWTFTWVLAKISPDSMSLLLDAMLDHGPESYELAIAILNRVLHDGDSEDNKEKKSRPYVLKLADFRPQLLKMIQNVGRWGKPKSSPPPWVERSGIYLDTEYHFENIVAKMLAKGNKDSGSCKTALELARTLVQGERRNLVDSRVARPNSIVNKMLTDFPEIVWPIIGGAILKKPQFANRMWSVLGQPYNLNRSVKAPILRVSEDILFAWCHANPKNAPIFLAKCVPFLATRGNGTEGESLHPIMSRLLDEFGERNDVQSALERNIHPYHRVGSSVGYYRRLRKVLQRFETHTNPGVRQWAEKMGREVERCLSREVIQDEEREAQMSWMG